MIDGANCGSIYAVAAIAQLVERIHGKDEVPGSNPGRGSISNKYSSALVYSQSSFCFSMVVASWSILHRKGGLTIKNTAYAAFLKRFTPGPKPEGIKVLS